MLKKLKKLFKAKTEDAANSSEQNKQPLVAKLEVNIELLKKELEPSGDINYRFFEINTDPPTRACIIFLDNMIDKKALEENVLAPLLAPKPNIVQPGENLYLEIEQKIISAVETSPVTDLDGGVASILSAQGLLLLDGCSKALELGEKKLQERAISESATEPVIQGSRDGFVEPIGVNITLIRRRLKTPSLKVEKHQIGTLSNTDVAILYLDTVVKQDLIKEVKNRLLNINLDGVLGSGYLIEYMMDSSESPFPQINSTDRPDSVARGLLDGQVAVLVDNTPFALLMPVVFIQFLYAAEDYYIRYMYASFTRIIRFISVNIALLLPGFYIAIANFHQELLPTKFLLSIAAGREKVPFPSFVEAITMEATFEILREAGVRLPRPVGQATSIVGALVIGNAAVDAGLVSPVMVIVVALTALASFIIPSPNGAFAIRLLRFPVLFAAAFLGFYGLMLAIMAILIHLCSLRSFGVPYLSPFAPVMPAELKNTFTKAPWWGMIDRPYFLDVKDRKRQKRGQKPQKPPQGGKEG